MPHMPGSAQCGLSIIAGFGSKQPHHHNIVPRVIEREMFLEHPFDHKAGVGEDFLCCCIECSDSYVQLVQTEGFERDLDHRGQHFPADTTPAILRGAKHDSKLGRVAEPIDVIQICIPDQLSVRPQFDPIYKAVIAFGSACPAHPLLLGFKRNRQAIAYNEVIKRNTRKQTSAEENIRIVLDGVRGEASMAELCRREGIAQSLYYKGSKDFMEAGKQRLAGDIVRQANTSDVTALRRDARDLKEVVAEQTLELRLLKKNRLGDGDDLQ